MLYRLHDTWRKAGAENARPRSYVFMGKPDVVQQCILDSWGVESLMSDGDDEGEALRTVLRNLLRAVKRA